LKNIFLFFVFLNIQHASFAQEIHVFDSESNLPIQDVAVYTADYVHFSTTNIDGLASIGSFPENTQIYFQHSSYKSVSFYKSDLAESNFTISLKPKIIQIDEVVISANKLEQESTEFPSEVIAISPKTVSFAQPQTSADLLEGTGKIYVQKSQLGGGSPMLRGFAANSVLLVVDGIRMNNAIFREGNLQNIINIDPNVLEGAEVVLGPGSVMYGSDALGGVIDFHTREINLTRKKSFSGEGMVRFSSANLEKTAHANWEVLSKNFGWFGGFTYSSYDDLRAGSRRPVDHPDFGKRDFYVERIIVKDSVIANKNPNIQIPSGFNQYSTIQKFKWSPGNLLSMQYSFHLSNTNDIPRYDRLVLEENGIPDYAEWYYGPQFWMMNSFKILSGNTKLWNESSITFARQDFKESRNSRRFQNDTRQTQKENVTVYSINFEADKKFHQHKIYYGLEYIYNDVTSTAFRENITTGETSDASTRYPDGGSQTYSFSAFFNWKYPLVQDLLTLNAGGRYNNYSLNSAINGSEFPFNSIENNNQSYIGNLGLVYQKNRLKLSLLTSSGFRPPNIDDIAKVFDSEPGSVMVPNPDLKPEYSYNLEGSAEWRPSPSVLLKSTVFHNWLREAMVRSNFSFNGQDSIIYNGELSNVQALVNTGQAVIYGFDVLLSFEFFQHWGIETYLNYMKSRDLETGNSLRHTTPLFGKTSLYFQKGKTKIEFYSRYNGKIAYKDLPPSEQNKPHLYTSDGSLSWVTFNVRSNYRISKHLDIHATMENILDKNYRTYSSGISAPGINFILSLKASF